MNLREFFQQTTNEAMKCKICSKKTLKQARKTRDGSSRGINYCSACDFYFFNKGASDLIKRNEFEKERLKTANLAIPDIKTDFQNGTRQSKEYAQEFIRESDKKKNILEVGCSWGYFLNVLKLKKINPFGIELNPVRARYVQKKLKIPCFNNLEELEKQKVTFKKIFLFYVIQYIEQPKDYIERLLKLIDKQGCVYMITPNVNDVLLHVWHNKAYADFFFEKMTVAYYSVNAVKKLCAILNKNKSLSFTVATKQGYSFLNHANWYFTHKPRTTGWVGKDSFVDDVILGINSSHRQAGRDLGALISSFDRSYRSLIEKYSLGNQIMVKIKKVN